MKTFIVRLLHDASGGSRARGSTPRLRGVVDEVATGLRATFRNEAELVAALTAAVAAEPTGARWEGGDRAAPGSADEADQAQ